MVWAVQIYFKNVSFDSEFVTKSELREAAYTNGDRHESKTKKIHFLTIGSFPILSSIHDNDIETTLNQQTSKLNWLCGWVVTSTEWMFYRWMLDGDQNGLTNFLIFKYVYIQIVLPRIMISKVVYATWLKLLSILTFQTRELIPD